MQQRKSKQKLQNSKQNATKHCIAFVPCEGFVWSIPFQVQKRASNMQNKKQQNKKVTLHSHLVKGLFGLLRFGWGTFGPQNKQNKT